MYLRNQKEDNMGISMLRGMEEIHYPSKPLDVDAAAFKPSILQIAMMEAEHRDYDTKNTVIYTEFVTKEETPFLLVYLWIPGMNGGFKQLICSPGYRLNEKDEELLVNACLDENTVINRDMMFNVIWAYDKALPHTNIELYSANPLLSVLHMYFCMFHGIRELLFKAQLPYLASVLHRVDSLNLSPVMTKGRPVDLFEKGVTMRMLRLLNSEWGVEELVSEETRQQAIKIYMKFHKILGGYQSINQGQWRYLKDCVVNETLFRFSLQKLRFFGQGDTDELFQRYLVFMAKKRILNRYIEWNKDISDISQFNRLTQEEDLLLSYCLNKNEFDRLIGEQDSRLEYLDYSDSQYIVTHPSSVEDIYDECMAQQNCLMAAFPEICRGNFDIGFLRRKNAPKKPFITFQVTEDKEIVQIYGKFNQKILSFSEEMIWFRDVYVKEKGFELLEEVVFDDLAFM